MPRHNRHLLQGIIKLRSAITADLIASPINGKNPAQVLMATPECKIQNFYQRIDEPIPTGQFFTYRHFRSPYVKSHFDLLLRISVEAVRDFTLNRDRGHKFLGIASMISGLPCQQIKNELL